MLNLPLRIKVDEVNERDWCVRTEYKIYDSRDCLLAIFYEEEKLAKGYIAMMNALQD